MNNDIDVYKDIHKGIRAELFAVTGAAGALDAADEGARAAFVDRVQRLEGLLASHAEHEDRFLQPLIELHLPDLAMDVAQDHAHLEASFTEIVKTTREALDRRDLHEVYLELASFTSAYLRHQDVEERDIHPALFGAVGFEGLFEVHERLVASIPPPEMAASLSLMLPAMNLDDRTELLGGIRLGAPAEVFAGIWALAESVLLPADVAAVSARLCLR